MTDNHMISIDPMDTHSMERLACAMNAAALIRYHQSDSCFFSAHAQTVLAIYVHMTDLAGGVAVSPGADFTPIPGGPVTSVQAENSAVEKSLAALLGVETKKSTEPPAPITQPGTIMTPSTPTFVPA